MITYYHLNHFEIFDKFVAYFKENSVDLISNASRKPIATSLDATNSNFKMVDLELIEKEILHKNGSIKVTLSSRQKECLFHLVRGMTIKQVADTLKLSPRTVEHYIEAVKAKLDCNTRFDLIEKYRTIFEA